jgi:hypothetical protein
MLEEQKKGYEMNSRCVSLAFVLAAVVLLLFSLFAPSNSIGVIGPLALSSFHEMFQDILCSGLESRACKAVYDTEDLPAFVMAFDDEGNSPVFGPLVESWVAWDAGLVPKRKKERPQPEKLERWQSQKTTGHQLRLLRATTSIAIGRIHRDRVLIEDYQRTTNVAARQVLVSQFRRALHAIVSEFFIVLQLIVDVMDSDLKNSLKLSNDLATDVLLQILATTKFSDTPETIEWRLRNFRPTSTDKKKVFSAFSLDFFRPVLDKVFPARGRFWITFRSSTGCHSLIRSCEDPEACRFVCNPRFLMFASDLERKKTSGRRLRFVGIGSNNEWGWEESTMRMFSPYTSQTLLPSLTTIDCTVKNWRLPEELLTGSLHFQTARACVGQVRDSNVIRMDDLKALVRQGEGAFSGTVASLSKQAAAEKQGVGRITQGAGVNELLDEVSLLKIDAESHEHSAVSVWAKLELRDLKRSLSGKFSAELSSNRTLITEIDFERDIPSFFTISMFQLELHEYRGVPMEPWLLQGVRLKQYLTSLGFIQVSQEPNFFHDCCFELVFVHYRYFIRSEVWHALEVAV